MEIDLKKAVVKLSQTTNEIHVVSNTRRNVMITKCKQDKQGRVYITVDVESMTRQKRKPSTKKKKTRTRKTSKRRKKNKDVGIGTLINKMITNSSK